MEQIIIIGKGGHARSIVDAIECEGKYQIAGYVINEEEIEEENNDYPVIGKDENLQELYSKGIHYAAIGIGYLGKGSLRRKLYETLKQVGYSIPIICDPSAIISAKTKIEEGTFIGKGVIINAGTTIEKMCIINSGAIVEHDCYVEEFSHVAVGTVLCGGVHIGKDVFIGANATVIQEVKISNSCVIGAGEILKKNLSSKEVYCNSKL